MNRTILILIVFSFPSIIFPQNLKFGLFLGGNISNHNVKYNFNVTGIDTSYSNSPRVLMNLGGFARMDVFRYLGIRGEVQYVKSGSTITTNRVGGTINQTPVERTYTSSIDYIRFALIPSFVLHSAVNANLTIGAGSYYSYKMGAKEFNNQNTLIQNAETSRSIDRQLKNWDYGLVFSLGLEYIPKDAIGYAVDLRYNLGLQNILEQTLLEDKISLKNYSFSLNLGIIFNPGL